MRTREAIRNVCLFMIIPFIFAGCMTARVMTDKDREWIEMLVTEKQGLTKEQEDDLHEKIVAGSMTPEEFKAEQEKVLGDIVTIKNAVMAAVGVPEPAKDLTDDLMKWLILGGGGAGLLGAVGSSLRNAPAGKFVGPVFKKKEA